MLEISYIIQKIKANPIGLISMGLMTKNIRSKCMKVSEEIKIKHADGLKKLLDYFGKRSIIADKLGLSAQGVGNWFRVGKIGREGAKRLEKYDPVHFKKEELRPDILNW